MNTNLKHVAVGIIKRLRSDNEYEYLLISAKKDFGEFTGAYYPPGGHVETGENEQKAVEREIYEELGLTVKATQKLAETPGDVANQITHWWGCELISGEIKIQEDEIADARWFTREEMRSIKIWPATRKFFDQYIFSA